MSSILLLRGHRTKESMASPTIDKSKPYFPLAGGADDGWSTEDEATATCFCGAVQLSFVSFDSEPALLIVLL